MGGRLPADTNRNPLLPCHHTLRKQKERPAEVASAGAGNTVGTADKILGPLQRTVSTDRVGLPTTQLDIDVLPS